MQLISLQVIAFITILGGVIFIADESSSMIFIVLGLVFLLIPLFFLIFLVRKILKNKSEGTNSSGKKRNSDHDSESNSDGGGNGSGDGGGDGD